MARLVTITLEGATESELEEFQRLGAMYEPLIMNGKRYKITELEYELSHRFGFFKEHKLQIVAKEI